MACCKKKPMDEKPEVIVPFPDGGWGWLVCLATFSTQFIVLGTMNNFGVMYVELLNEFNTGKADAGNADIFLSLLSYYRVPSTKTRCKWACLYCVVFLISCSTLIASSCCLYNPAIWAQRIVTYIYPGAMFLDNLTSPARPERDRRFI